MAARSTPFAEKYGHPRGKGHEVLEEWLPLKKSGLTPASPSVVDWESLASVEAHSKLEHYQRIRFYGFTARELESIGALADYRPGTWDSVSTLQWADLDMVPLHPIFERQHWEKEGLLPSQFPKHPYGDRNKFWEVKGNDDIWEALQPALKIATLVLTNTATWQWYDAFLDGIYEEVADDDLPVEFRKKQPGDPGYWRYFPNNKPTHQEKMFEHRRILDGMVGLVQWGLGAGAVTPECFPSGGFTSGETFGPKTSLFNPNGESVILVAHDLIEPLLNPNQLPGDEALDTFQLASLVLHELTHAMCTHLAVKIDSRFYHEPYFMEEPLNETGFSMQAAVFGGINIALINLLDIQGKSCGGIIQNNFPTVWYHHVCDPPVLRPSRKNPLWDTRSSYPVPINWFMALHHQTFWNLYLRSYGPKATHMGPKIVGLYQRWDDSLFTTAPRGHEDINPIDPSSRPGLAMEAVLIENSRRQIVKQIMDKSRGLKPLQPDQYYHVARPKMRDRATYSGQFCPRYEEIRRYFEDNKTALGLGTMDFLIPSPLLRMYVDRVGGINLTNSEWTNFFRVANDRNELFSYSNAGLGMIGLLKDGWTKPEIPIAPLRRRGSLMHQVSTRLQSSFSVSKPKEPPHPSDRLATKFAWLCGMVFNDIDLEHSTPDVCKKFFFRDCNIYWKSRDKFFKDEGLEIRDMPNGFPDDWELFDRCIYWSKLFHNEAPKGMVRRKFLKVPDEVKIDKKPLREKCTFQSRVVR